MKAKVSGVRAKFSVLESSAKIFGSRLEFGYSQYNPRKNKFTQKTDINSVINRRGTRVKVKELRKSDRSKEKRLVESIKSGKIRLVGELGNAVYGHLI